MKIIGQLMFINHTSIRIMGSNYRHKNLLQYGALVSVY